MRLYQQRWRELDPAAASYVDKSKLVADRFHLMKYINRAARYTQDEAGITKDGSISISIKISCWQPKNS